MSTEPREKRLADYNELLEGLLEMVAMQEEAGGEDEELSKLIADAEEQLRALASSLNAEEAVEVTPDLLKVQLPPEAGKAAEGQSSGGNGSEEAPVILFPPPDQPRLSAPYEVLYDERAWYPCVITAVVPPAEPTDRQMYKAWILGYNVEETVLHEALRQWGKAQEAERKNAIRSGAVCHAISPRSGRFEKAVIERLTLEGTVLVTFHSNAPPTSSSSAVSVAAKSVELPLSHVHTASTFHAVLRKRPQLTEEEKKARRQENARRKRERAEEEKQLRSDKIAQDASDWQAMMGDLMGSGGRRRRR